VSNAKPYHQLQLPGGWDLLELHRHAPDRYPHLLESSSKGKNQGRYDLLFAFPEERISAEPSQFLSRLDSEYGTSFDVSSEEGPPFQGGWFLYLGYELAHAIEPVLGEPIPHPWGWETAWAQYFPAAIIHDHVLSRRYVVSMAGRKDLLELIFADVMDAVDAVGRKARARDIPSLEVVSLQAPADDAYLEAVARILSFICEGDVFQVNLSHAWNGELGAGVSAADLYAALRRANPAPFSGLATWGRSAVVSSSPERLVEADQGWAAMRPIAGTHPRATDPAQDRKLRERLMAHPKEQAEHIMLVDLIRNDLGRIARLGTVEVDELMVCETYRHVHHIVSNVRARLQESMTPGQVIRAVFPGGTITGCPKVRCMEILNQLETTARGAYTGSMGYLSRHGRMDLNILIRSFEVQGRNFRFRTGAGIVADSRPGLELQETHQKAKGLLRALG